MGERILLLLLRLSPWIFVTVLALLVMVPAYAQDQIPAAAKQYRSELQREAQFVFGLRAPVPMFAAQIEQESSWRTGVTAWDNGRGLAQFMDPTAKFISETYPELGQPDPYNPRWAIRAMVRLNKYNFERVKGLNLCHQWAAALKAYNAGLGWVMKAQQLASEPGKWFGHVEDINAGQSQQNFEYSRLYPRKILYNRQAKYAQWGALTC
jgi:soluble lytic murein transglycosylase-like protein